MTGRRRHSTRGRWICRLLGEALSLACMALVVWGCWRQIVINIDNIQPVTGLPVSIIYVAGLACCAGIGVLNLMTLGRLVSGRVSDAELVVGAESEELTAFEAQQKEALNKTGVGKP